MPKPIAVEVFEDIEIMADEHARRCTWRNMPKQYWLYRLMEEVHELHGTLIGQHNHSTDLELREIAGICINWLDMRRGE